jgi:hypothetical protein
MNIDLRVYRHKLTRDYHDFVRQSGCTAVVVHLANDFNRGPSNAQNDQSTGSNYEPGRIAGG